MQMQKRPSNKRLVPFLAFILLCTGMKAAQYPRGFLIEAESFSNKGGWQVDQQFMDQMGSP